MNRELVEAIEELCERLERCAMSGGCSREFVDALLAPYLALAARAKKTITCRLPEGL